MNPNLCTICETNFTKVKKRKQIIISSTVLFADLRGYTSLSERTDGPDEYVGLLKKVGFEMLTSENAAYTSLAGVAASPRHCSGVTASRFYIASGAKQFTAATVLRAAQSGFLSLDDSVRKHVPELPAYADRVTIRHLIHHTSGFRDYLTLQAMTGAQDNWYLYPSTLVALLSRQKRLFFTVLSILALLTNYDRGSCLIYVGTEGTPEFHHASRRIDPEILAIAESSPARCLQLFLTIQSFAMRSYTPLLYWLRRSS